MKKLYYFGLLGIMLFEIFNVYFIMPMPGSQRMNSIDVAYFLYSYRWIFRILFIVMILAGIRSAFGGKRRWLPAIAAIVPVLVVYQFNFKMVADKMFQQPQTLTFKGKGENKLNDSTVVVVVYHNNSAKAYPMRYIVYHHQVRDTVGGKPLMITYCSVCRTGRVFEPVVNGKEEHFRLVGMDHFNAMFEDATTESWWRQATGEAITGAMKGTALPDFESTQLTVGKFFSLYPRGKVMQEEIISRPYYDSLGRYEKGRSRNGLTRSDTTPWNPKSWVIGIQLANAAKAYDWNGLKKKRVINDKVGDTDVVLAISDDSQSFVVFERPAGVNFTVRNDTLFSPERSYNFGGHATVTPLDQLKPIKAYQEFWHSWSTFHPNTAKHL